MNGREITLIYLKYTGMVLLAVFIITALLAKFVLANFQPHYAIFPALLGLASGIVLSTHMLCKRICAGGGEKIGLIFLKYTLLALIIVESFFSMQVLFVLKEFKPQFVVVPTVLGLVIGVLLSSVMLLKERLAKRNLEIDQANTEIKHLNELLHMENRRMSAELTVTRQLQQMLLPRQQELDDVEHLDIAAYMEPATEVGGDYYDVLQHDGRVKIGIGDVTGHGLESGVLMLMVQMAVRTLLANNVSDPALFLQVLNQAVFKNVQRMGSDKNLTLALLDYEAGILRLTGQHEEILVVRRDGKIERIDTIDLGFMVGIEPDIGHWLSSSTIKLNSGDGVVLYTDGITEACDENKQYFGVERLCQIISEAWQGSAQDVLTAVVDSVREHMAGHELQDDITLLVCKQR